MSMLFRFVKAIFGSFWWKIRGFEVWADRDVQAFREKQCHACEKFDPVTETCRICGCCTIAKGMLARESCPLGKWLRIKRKRGEI